MGCLMFFMSAGLIMALGVYMGTMFAYLAVFFTAMAGYLSVCASVITAFMMWLML